MTSQPSILVYLGRVHLQVSHKGSDGKVLWHGNSAYIQWNSQYVVWQWSHDDVTIFRYGKDGLAYTTQKLLQKLNAANRGVETQVLGLEIYQIHSSYITKLIPWPNKWAIGTGILTEPKLKGRSKNCPNDTLPLNWYILTKNEDIGKLSIWTESHEKGLQNVPLQCLHWIKIEQDMKVLMQKCKTLGQFFEPLYIQPL